MENLWSPDLLSDLPLCIIHVILSLVPIRDAVRTSILSQKWRFIWSSLPHLAFDNECVNPPMKTKRGEKRLIHFISQALLLHDGPIHKFELRFPHMVNSQCINQWLFFLSRNGIRILLLESDDEYEGDFGYWFKIPSSLYFCQNLTSLKLHVHSIPPPPPSFKGFLFLKSLDIRIYELNSIVIGNIVSHSPLLEELTLDGIEDTKLTICALNLKYLHFVCPCDDLSLCTPLIHELKVDFEDVKSFSIGVDSMVFHHLRTIELSSVPFYDQEVAPAVIRLITGSPNLQKLEISAQVSLRVPPEVACFWDTVPAPDITYNSLKVIKMACFDGYIDEMKFIEFLLARSPVLEILMLHMAFPLISDGNLLKLTTQLHGYQRASANAQIVII